MRTVFFGWMHIHHNSVEGGVKYFYTPTYKSMLSSMVKYLVDEKYINPEEHDISFSNAVDFMTDGDGSSVMVEGKSDEETTVTLLDDLTSDNLIDDGWFEYSAPGGGVIDPDKFVVLTIAYNSNFHEEGYDQQYHSIACKKENVEKEFSKWARDIFCSGDIFLPDNIEKAVKLVNNRYPDEEDHRAGACLTYRIEAPVTGEKIAGETII